MKTVLVFEFETEDQDEVQSALVTISDAMRIDRLPGAKVHAAIGTDAQEVVEYFLPPGTGVGTHLVTYDREEDVVTVTHSIQCRRAGEMDRCKVLTLARVGIEVGHFLPDEGQRLPVTLDESGVLLWQ